MNKIIIIMIAAAVLAGCTSKYHLKKCAPMFDPATSQVLEFCTEAIVKSRREYENVELRYNPDTNSVEFSAGKVSNSVSPLEQAAAAVIMSLPTVVASGDPD